MKKKSINDQYLRFQKLASLITESEYERLVSEAEEGGNTDQKVKDILGANYPEFVQKLGDNIKDPKFVAAVEKFSKENPIKTTDIDAEVSKLLPTQNEIAAANSLMYPLTDPETAETVLKGGTVAPGGRKIVTASNGKYIVDGHHRWSQVYVINPKCKISALDISNVDNPVDALKSAQLGIAADIGSVPSGKAGGVDMLKSGEDEIKKYIIDTIKDPVVEVFKKYGKGDTKEAIADYIWGNVKQMQSKNKPASNAPKRDLMPQTDDAPNWNNKAPALESYKKMESLLRESIKKSTLKK